MLNVDQITLGLFFVANAMFCAAYVVRDIFRLRVLSVFACLLAYPYFIFRDPVLYAPIFWYSMYALINMFNISHLIYEDRAIALEPHENSLKNLVFKHFTAADFKRLLAIAEWKTATRDQVLIRENSQVEDLYLLTSGALNVLQNDQQIARRLPGSFVGELAFLTGDPASAEVVFSEDSKYLHWTAEDLNRLLTKRPSLNKAFEALLTLDVAEKLKKPN